MSFVVLGGSTPLVDELVARVVKDDDLVRVVEPDALRAAELKEIGAFVAVGDPTDPDLVERAAQGARTAVVLESTCMTPEVLEALTGAGVSRVVYLGRSRAAIDVATASRLEHVVLKPRRGLLGRREALASTVSAIVAADDLPGSPRLTIDLADGAAVRSMLGGD